MLRPVLLVSVLLSVLCLCHAGTCHDLSRESNDPPDIYLIRCCPDGTAYLINNEVVSYTREKDVRCTVSRQEGVPEDGMSWPLIIMIILSCCVGVATAIVCIICFRRRRYRQQQQRLSQLLMDGFAGRMGRIRRWLHQPVTIPQARPAAGATVRSAFVKRSHTFATNVSTNLDNAGARQTAGGVANERPLILLRSQSTIGNLDWSLYEEVDESISGDAHGAGELAMGAPSLSAVYGDVSPTMAIATEAGEAGVDGSSHGSGSSTAPSCFSI